MKNINIKERIEAIRKSHFYGLNPAEEAIVNLIEDLHCGECCSQEEPDLSDDMEDKPVAPAKVVTPPTPVKPVVPAKPATPGRVATPVKAATPPAPVPSAPVVSPKS